MQRRLPEELDAYAGRPVARFHMPGHKGRGMGGFFRPELAGWDVTELSFSDNLHAPKGSIACAQDEYAARIGAEHTFFLVNGSTAGIHALLLALPENSDILIARDCHRAVIAGAALFGHRCAFLEPAHVGEESLFGAVTAETLAEELRARHADAVFITSPNYYGLCADIPALAAVAHEHGALLYVDAAHGAHFPFSKSLPPSPAGYADAWVHSAHKTLNALGQAALLHIGPGMRRDVVQRALALVETSSPSYLLMASLDWARYTADLNDCWTKAAARCEAFSAQVDGTLGLYTLPHILIGSAGIASMDPTRVVIDVHARGITGYMVQAALEKQDIYVELSDMRRIVLICTPADDPAWYSRILEALCELPYGEKMFAAPFGPAVAPGETIMPARAAVRAPTRACPFEAAAGEIAADPAGIYPPGIPCIMPGMRITGEAIEHIRRHVNMGASVFGIRDGMIAVVDRGGPAE